jgi:hypothetical protein
MLKSFALRLLTDSGGEGVQIICSVLADGFMSRYLRLVE